VIDHQIMVDHNWLITNCVCSIIYGNNNHDQNL